MKTFRVEVTRVLSARAEDVYRVISDMSEHRHILPKEFESVEILAGGVGAGTVLRTQMNVMGTRVVNTLTVSEPEPGRIMREVDATAGVDTLWTVTPIEGGARCNLKLATEFRSKPGLAGFLERLLNPAIVRSLYRRELDLLEAYLQKRSAA